MVIDEPGKNRRPADVHDPSGPSPMHLDCRFRAECRDAPVPESQRGGGEHAGHEGRDVSPDDHEVGGRGPRWRAARGRGEHHERGQRYGLAKGHPVS